ncbi:RNA-directed DNA polymerase from mobile element jockey [Aphis craccivora]|uniref:RNA-directed DNA polymerase from mobile element jockey n=1 Tax=Aphis craccivora TaxID=307492 RepID=A0A6G0XQV3_APHCR|nr:RNA-directed DNA polymerase from mobile element jockey [Aphis craccivora]
MALCNLILSYGITCWGGTNRTDINTLYTTQKMIIKVAYSLPLKYPSQELFSHTNILSANFKFLLITRGKLFLTIQITNFCESQSNNTNDIAINKIVSDLDDDVCINKTIKSQYSLFYHRSLKSTSKYYTAEVRRNLFRISKYLRVGKQYLLPSQNFSASTPWGPYQPITKIIILLAKFCKKLDDMIIKRDTCEYKRRLSLLSLHLSVPMLTTQAKILSVQFAKIFYRDINVVVTKVIDRFSKTKIERSGKFDVSDHEVHYSVEWLYLKLLDN